MAYFKSIYEMVNGACPDDDRWGDEEEIEENITLSERLDYLDLDIDTAAIEDEQYILNNEKFISLWDNAEYWGNEFYSAKYKYDIQCRYIRAKWKQRSNLAVRKRIKLSVIDAIYSKNKMGRYKPYLNRYANEIANLVRKEIEEWKNAI